MVIGTRTSKSGVIKSESVRHASRDLEVRRGAVQPNEAVKIELCGGRHEIGQGRLKRVRIGREPIGVDNRCELDAGCQVVDTRNRMGQVGDVGETCGNCSSCWATGFVIARETSAARLA